MNKTIPTHIVACAGIVIEVYTRIVLDTNLKNERAQHVYEQLGFRKLRVNIDEWEDQLGVPQSSVDYELTLELFQDYSLGSIASPEMPSSIKLL